MSSASRQVWTLTRLGLGSIPQRAGESIAVAVSAALAVSVLLAALAMERGFRATIDGSGSAQVAIAQRAGSNSELDSVVPVEQARILEAAPGLAPGDDGAPLLSAEAFVTVDGVKRVTGLRVNLPLRGVGPHGPELREGFAIVSGRMFTPGMNELIVGRGARREFSGLEVGEEVAFGATRWRVVGEFAVPGTVFDSEIWGDVNVVQSQFSRGATVQTIRMRLASPQVLEQLRVWIEADPRLRLDVSSEREFFAAQSTELSSVILWLGWPLSIAIAAGALAGAVNVSFASVRARAGEIATLRAIGFSGAAAFVGALAEPVVLTAVGGLTGAFVAYSAFDGLSASTLGSNFSQVVFSFSVTPGVALTGFALALAIGLSGGLAPAIQAATAPITNVHKGAS